MAITPTTITTEDQIYLTGSPINIRVQNFNNDATIKSAVVEIYIWNGNLNNPPATATQTLKAGKVSKLDNYINFQISELIASYITGLKFAWISGDNAPSLSGEGVFFQLKHQVTNENGTIEAAYESLTNFATLGYRNDFEHIGTVLDGQPYNGLLPINYNRNYSERIKYFQRSFDFTKTLGECTSENIIASTPYVPTNTKCQLGDKYLIVYINRLGLWDYFTPYGKAVESIDINSDTYPRLYRNTNSINANISHFKSRVISETPQTVTINTGSLHEGMTEQVEELIYSPLIYLIKFTGETFIVINVGLTVDNTIVTVDSTLYTADNQTVTEQDLGYYSNFKQSPVICTNKNFTRKTRLNDKQKINYDLTFEITSDRINNLR